MPGGRVPKLPGQRVGRHAPRLGEWQHVAGSGWRHGPVPRAPRGLSEATRRVWATWFAGWWAAKWTPDDLPVLELIIRLFDQVAAGEARASDRSELRLLMDGYGITPKGRQSLRWLEPKAPEPEAEAPASSSTYAHLRTVEGGQP